MTDLRIILATVQAKKLALRADTTESHTYKVDVQQVPDFS